MVRVEYGVDQVEYEKNQTMRHPRDKTHPRVDEFCQVDGAEFDFGHISTDRFACKWYIDIIPQLKMIYIIGEKGGFPQSSL